MKEPRDDGDKNILKGKSHCIRQLQDDQVVMSQDGKSNVAQTNT